MSKQRGHGVITAQRGAVYRHEFSRHPMARLTKLKNTFGEDGLPGARWAGQQDRIGRSDRHALNTIDKRVERRVPRLDACLQEGDGLLLLALKAAGERRIAA